MGETRKIVIIGGVACGAKAAARARRRDSEAQITVIERGSYASYAGCGLPFFVAGAVPEVETLLTMSWGTVRDPQFFKSAKNIDLLLNTEVEKIDREKKEVVAKDLASGESKIFPYDNLVIASGAGPVKPPFEGMDLKNVFTLRKPEDAQAIVNCINELDAEKACIVGGGRIALEVVDALVAQAVDSTIVELMDHVLPNVIDAEIAAILTKALKGAGAVVHTGEKVVRLEGDEAGNVKKVITDKREIETDFAVVAVGVKPNVGLAKAAGLDLTERGLIAVDDHMQTSDPDIYAGGDCVENVDLVTGAPTYAPLGSTANKHGRVIGTNITGGDVSFPGVLGTSIMKTCGLNVVRTGLSEEVARDRGYKTVTALVGGHDKSHFYPGGKEIIIKLVADEGSGRILGGQMIGSGDVARRNDALVGMMSFQATADRLADIDMCYAPPFSSAIDTLIHCANMIRNKRDGLADSLSMPELKKKLDSGENFTLLDVRAEKEFEANPFFNDDSRRMAIPLEGFVEKADSVPKDKPVVVVCALGTRSYEVQAMLRQKGWKDVRYVEGGVMVWNAMDLD